MRNLILTLLFFRLMTVSIHAQDIWVKIKTTSNSILEGYAVKADSVSITLTNGLSQESLAVMKGYRIVPIANIITLKLVEGNSWKIFEVNGDTALFEKNKPEIVFIEDNPDFLTKQKPTGLSKNVVYGTFGFLLLYSTANINYERMIADNELGSLWIKAGCGYYFSHFDLSEDVYGNQFVLGFTGLTGTAKSHFEINAGYLKIVNVSTHGRHPDFVPLSGSIGYRYQKPKGNFIFRTGAGYPEAVYFSLGFCF